MPAKPPKKTSRNTHSLWDLHPRRFDVLIAIIVSFGFLLQGLTQPLIHVEKMMLWKSTYSVYTGILSLFEQGEYLLSAVLFFFSFIFPIGKLLTLAYLWVVRLTEEKRVWIFHWLEALGKWSMLDVFIVAILIVAVKLGPLADIQPRRGVYFFCLAIICSMLTTMHIERIARSKI